MADDPSNLGNLHDIIVPDRISWWPPAPGWIALALVLAAVVIYYVHRFYRRWRADAYRREALRELATAASTASIAEILRRTALAIAPRDTIADLWGVAWCDWLSERLPKPLSVEATTALAQSVYHPEEESGDPEPLRRFAEHWIRHHTRPC